MLRAGSNFYLTTWYSAHVQRQNHFIGVPPDNVNMATSETGSALCSETGHSRNGAILELYSE